MDTNQTVEDFETVADLIEFLSKFDKDMKVVGVGGGNVTVTQQSNYPDLLWFE